MDATKGRAIGGWLVLLGISNLIYSVRLVLGVLAVYIDPLPDNTWIRLTTPGENLYHPMWKPALLLDKYGFIILFLMALWQFVLFARRKKAFLLAGPAFLVISAAVQICRYFAGFSIPAAVSRYDEMFYASIAYSVASAIIWIPYLRLSERAKCTFIR